MSILSKNTFTLHPTTWAENIGFAMYFQSGDIYKYIQEATINKILYRTSITCTGMALTLSVTWHHVDTPGMSYVRMFHTKKLNYWDTELKDWLIGAGLSVLVKQYML